MSLTRSEAEASAAGSAVRPATEPDVPGEGWTEPAAPSTAALPAVPGLVMLAAAEDASVCSDGTCL
ncbi:hypothetical protein [Plantactinospora endophytica]|uniref:Uncharacterized protein n=1 Tax=Plantactinospora endophytica TaxID=673535 RepID=A0ABQ4DXD1_9ACTN|nr:hypothetical protein [Plantactinospora endophytica]GIG87109.1 hypothetical protein Pen02_20450 [Plantactinospora endophytica]